MTKIEVLNALQPFCQEKIFAKYLGLNVEDVIELSNSEQPICSPLRTDKNPSFAFQKQRKNNTGGEGYVLRARDFVSNFYNHGIYFWGDCFDAVRHYLERHQSELNNQTPKKEKEWFAVILKHIIKTFDIDIFGKVNNDNNIEINYEKYEKEVTFKTRERKQFSPQFREWNEFDKDYWSSYNISKQQLEDRKVYPVNNIWIWSSNNQDWILIYSHRDNDICYCYDYGLDEDGIRIYKFYFVLRNKHQARHRFMTNMTNIPFLENKYLGVITDITRIGCLIKATKDALVGANLKIFNEKIQFYEIPSETTIPTDEEIKEISKRHDILLVFTDFDYAGVRFVNSIRKQFNVIPIFLTNGKYRTVNYGAKDLSDFQRLGGRIDILITRLELHLKPLIDKILNSNHKILTTYSI